MKHVPCVKLLIVFQSSAPVELTEAEAEYSTNVVKHIFYGHVVLQYNYANTIPEQLLEEASSFLLCGFVFMSCVLNVMCFS
jgi:hypothetical protein